MRPSFNWGFQFVLALWGWKCQRCWKQVRKLFVSPHRLGLTGILDNLPREGKTRAQTRILKKKQNKKERKQRAVCFGCLTKMILDIRGTLFTFYKKPMVWQYLSDSWVSSLWMPFWCQSCFCITFFNNFLFIWSACCCLINPRVLLISTVTSRSAVHAFSIYFYVPVLFCCD